MKRYKVLFNPFVLSIQIPFLFLIIPQIIFIILLNGEDSILSDSVIIIFIISIYIGCCIRVPLIKIPDIKNYKLIKLSLYAICLICAVPLIPTLLRYGLSLRGLRQFYEDIVFSPYSSLYSILKIAITCLIIVIFIHTRRVSKEIILLSVILLFSGSKMAMLNTFIVFAALWEQYRSMNYKKLIIISIFAAIAMVAYHAAQNTNDKVNAAEGALSYFDVYNQQTLALNMLTEGKIDYYHGEIYLSSYYKIIPRLIWTDKPKDFGFALLNYKIYPQYSAEGYMPSFGLAYTFADFGFISIIISGLLAGFFKNLWYKEFIHNKKNAPAFIIYVLSLDIVIYVILTVIYVITSLKHDTKNHPPMLVKW